MPNAVIENIKSIAIALGFAFVFQTTAFATYYIPSESMVPTLQVGDRLAAAKYAYGYSRFSLPFELALPASLHGRLFDRLPTRGDVIVFMHPKSGERMIKRVIGLPGDHIAITHDQLVINGEPVARRFERRYSYREYQGSVVRVAQYTEMLPGGRSHEIIERIDRRWATDMAERVVPAGHYFMMGDNRDNSADSRFAAMGFVPEENLVGRAEAILFSLYSCTQEQGTECASKRFASIIH